MTRTPRWRVRKLGGRWIVRRPDGVHFGTYFTWTEAIAQVAARKPQPTPAAHTNNAGTFERAWSPSFVSREPVGFQRPGSVAT